MSSLYCTVMGITALPIHDCLIVGKSHKGQARGIMQLMARKVLGREVPCEKKDEGEEDMDWLDCQDEE